MKFKFKQGDIVKISGNDEFLKHIGEVLDKKIIEIKNNKYYIEELGFNKRRGINKEYLEMRYELKKSGSNSVKKL